MQRLRVKPIQMGHYSRGIILPAWWFKLNGNTKELELVVTVDSIEIRPLADEDADELTGPSGLGATGAR